MARWNSLMALSCASTIRSRTTSRNWQTTTTTKKIMKFIDIMVMNDKMKFSNVSWLTAARHNEASSAARWTALCFCCSRCNTCARCTTQGKSCIFGEVLIFWKYFLFCVFVMSYLSRFIDKRQLAQSSRHRKTHVSGSNLVIWQTIIFVFYLKVSGASKFLPIALTQCALL